MVGELAARHALSKEVVEGVSERTGGVPLFVEEVTRLLLERGEEGGLQAIPPTLQQSLAARLDRLGEAREVAQIGAVLGRDFTYALLRAVGGVDDPALQSALDRLADADLLFVEGAGAAGELSLQARADPGRGLRQPAQEPPPGAAPPRRRSPARRARARRSRAGSHRPSFHRSRPRRPRDRMVGQGGRPGAAPLGLPGGDRPSRQGDRDGGQGGGRKRRTSRASGGNCTSPMATRSSRRAATARRRRPKPSQEPASSALATRTRPERLAADYGLWVGSLRAGRAVGDEGARRRPSSATSRRDPIRPRPASLTARPGSRIGSPESMSKRASILERALALFQPGRDDDLAFRFGQDAGVAAMLYLALTLWPLGDIGRAVSLVGDAEARIAGLAHIGTRAYGNMHAALFELMRGDLSRAAPNAAELAQTRARARSADVASVRGLSRGLGEGSRAARPAAGSRTCVAASNFCASRTSCFFDGLVKIALAEAEARAGDVDRAVAILDEALATCERTGHRAFEAELHRVRGEMLLKRDPANPGARRGSASRPQSPSPSSKPRAASNCARRSRSPSSINRPAAPPTPTPSSRPRSKAFRRRRKCPRSPRRRRCSRRSPRRTRSGPTRRSGGGGCNCRSAYGERAHRRAAAMALRKQQRRSREALAATGDDAHRSDWRQTYGLWVGSYLRGELA